MLQYFKARGERMPFEDEARHIAEHALVGRRNIPNQENSTSESTKTSHRTIPEYATAQARAWQPETNPPVLPGAVARDVFSLSCHGGRPGHAGV